MTPSTSASLWRNFAQNLYYEPPPGTYFTPTNAVQLREILAQAASQQKKVRVTGQRHSQPPLVASGSVSADLFLVDMSCYADLGDNGTERMLVVGTSTVRVNTGVREDELDVFLASHQLMLNTATAGGFFSIGGMTAVDVHGATIDAPIFAETASSFTIMRADGSLTTIDADTPAENGWSPLQFARVSLGALGVVTSVTLNVLPRPFANSLTASVDKYDWSTKADFTSHFATVLASKTRAETFFNPYVKGVWASPFLVCGWNVEGGSGAPPNLASVPTACERASQQTYGATELPAGEEWLAEHAALLAQEFPSKDLGMLFTERAIATIEKQVTESGRQGSDLWLSWAARVMFMSYFIELPDLAEAGLGTVWDVLQSVKRQVIAADTFHVAVPLEFRFIKGGNTAMAGTYSSKPSGSYFVNFDLIAFAAVKGETLEYTDKLKRLFSSVEREWVALGGWPHQGKMYGFFDPTAPDDSFSEPFNPAFMDVLRHRRGARVQAFNAYRKKCDPGGMFCTGFVSQLVGE